MKLNITSMPKNFVCLRSMAKMGKWVIGKFLLAGTHQQIVTELHFSNGLTARQRSDNTSDGNILVKLM